MDPSRFRDARAGTCVRIAGGHWAFVPAPLPPPLTFDVEMAMALSRADAALGEVAGMSRSGLMPRLELLVRAFARREALLSSRIEGTETQLDELLLAEVTESVTPRDPDLREVQNYLRAMEEGIKLLGKLPIASRLVLRLHETLMRGVRGGDKTPGEFRRVQNFIGPPGATIATAKYVPPPVARINELLANWERFVNERDRMPDLIQCAIMHEQFEAIHPFQDGNGRVGRLLIPLFLIERKRLSQPLLYLSAFIDAHRRDYYDLLQAVRTDGDWDGWIRFFLTGVAETSAQAVRQAQALDELRRDQLGRLPPKPRPRALLDQLFINPYVTVARAAAQLGVTKPTAQRTIDVLQRHGILSEVTGRQWGRMWLAKPILQALEDPPEAG